MASVNFRYRSKKPNNPVTLRLVFGSRIIEAKTKYFPYSQDELNKNPDRSAKHYWQKLHKLRRTNDAEIKAKQTEVKKELNALESHVLMAFHDADAAYVTKKWLEKTIEAYYSPTTEAPKDLLGYFDYYVQKNTNLKPGTVRKIRAAKNRVDKVMGNIPISQINDQYRERLEKALHDYAPNTIAGTLKEIRTICAHAAGNDIKVSKKVLKWKLSHIQPDIVYLSPDEIKAVRELEGLPDYLDNARDWLVISCYTGQRVGDFLRFDKSMIRHEKNRDGKAVPLLEFKQRKTGKTMAIPLHSEVIKILDKRGGDFPRPISSIKYNVYVKEVAHRAGLTQPTRGNLRNGARYKVGKYPKWRLVSSHIGRRSYASNNFGIIPTHLLMYATGHTREDTFLAYVGKTNTDKGKELANYY